MAALKEMCVPFDHQFEATYRPVHNLAGTAPAPLVTFGVHDHYGTPGFFERRHALLVVTRAEDGAYLQKYMGFGAYRVAGGGWAVCGSQKSGANAPPQARPLTFLEPIRDLHGEDPAKLAEWRANSDLRIEGAQLFCRRGVPVGEYLDYLRDGVLKARGVTLAPVPTQ